jgi:8-oxo-dGTP diphosphatase
MIVRIGPRPRPGLRHRLRPGAYAVLLRGGRVLLTEQSTPDLREVQLPGGGVDPGESPLPALAREVREETGWTCRIERRVGAFRQFTWMPDYGIHAEKVCHVFLGRPGICLGPPPEAGHRALWMTPEAALRALAGDGNRRMLARALRIAGHGGTGSRRSMTIEMSSP